MNTNNKNIETSHTRCIQYWHICTLKYEIKKIIFALSYKNSSIRDTRVLGLKYLTFQNSLNRYYLTQKAQTMFEIMFIFEVITTMKINKTNIQTLYTHSIQYRHKGTLQYQKKQKIFAWSYKNSSIQDTMV